MPSSCQYVPTGVFDQPGWEASPKLYVLAVPLTSSFWNNLAAMAQEHPKNTEMPSMRSKKSVIAFDNYRKSTNDGEEEEEEV